MLGFGFSVIASGPIMAMLGMRQGFHGDRSKGVQKVTILAVWSGQGSEKVTMWPFGVDKAPKRSLCGRFGRLPGDTANRRRVDVRLKGDGLRSEARDFRPLFGGRFGGRGLNR